MGGARQRPCAAAANDRRGNAGTWLGRGGRGVRHGRCVRRSSQLRHGDSGTRAGGGRIPRGNRQSAGLALLRCLANVWPAAAVLRDQRRQHGFDDQPLHGQPQGAQQRRLLARRPDWVAAGSRDARVLPAGTGSLQRRPGDRGRRGGIAAEAGPLRLLERQGPPFDSVGLPGGYFGLWHGRGSHCPDRSPLGRGRVRAGFAGYARDRLRDGGVRVATAKTRWSCRASNRFATTSGLSPKPPS